MFAPRVTVFEPPAALAVLMAAISAACVLTPESIVLPSSCSKPSR
ncbi:MAG: hypothetical protein ABSG67_00045 [Thermoguttaceae bacterium]